MAENQIWYAALVRQLNDQFNRLRMVIHDGRR
jgi:flagellar basal body rod protein FlgB